MKQTRSKDFCCHKPMDGSESLKESHLVTMQKSLRTFKSPRHTLAKRGGGGGLP